MIPAPGRRKLPLTTLYGLAEKNYTGQFTAWISKEASNPTRRCRCHPPCALRFGGMVFAPCLIQQFTRCHVTDPQMPFFRVAKIKNKILAATVRIGFTG